VLADRAQSRIALTRDDLRRIGTLEVRRMRTVRPWTVIALVLFAVSSGATADLSGHWHVELSGADPFTEIVQTGSTVTFTLTLSGTPLVFDGNVSGDTLTASSDDGPCPVGISLRIVPGDAVMDGVSTVYGGPCTVPGKSRAFMSRCDCFDGNQNGGDGCDAACRVGPCYVCIGEPSICTPAGDGAACDDRRDCTTGETCSGGTCGAGSPVAPCVDLAGRWLRIVETDIVGDFEVKTDIDQRAGTLVFRNVPGGSLAWVGTIDPSTGAMDLEVPSTQLFCTDPATLTATAAADGTTFSGNGTSTIESPSHVCYGVNFTEQGFRCGGGTIDPGESCDDGNRTNGDGCNDACRVEPCFTCDGAGGCIDAPRADCLSPIDGSKSSLQLLDRTPDAKDRLKWRWRAGHAILLSQLGNPITTDAVATCLYDESTPTPTLLFRAVVPAGGTCGTKPCWRSIGSGGYRYKSRTGAEGIVGLSLRPGPDGKSRVEVKGAGAGLSGRPFGLPAPPLGLPLRMQVQVEGRGCFEVAHGAAGVIENEPGSFKGRGAP
jgi:cysteine-rich repeat protein